MSGVELNVSMETRAAVDFMSESDGDVQVVQRPDEAAVAFAYEDATDLPQAAIRPHSSLCAPATLFAVADRIPMCGVAIHLIELVIEQNDL